MAEEIKDTEKKEEVEEKITSKEDTKEACDCKKDEAEDKKETCDCKNDESVEGKETCENEEASKDEKSKKGIFGGKKNKEIEGLKEKIKEYEDQRLRQLAEFENFRERSKKEKAQMFEMGAKDVVEKLLPVVDNFERGLATVAEEDKGPFYEGIDMVYKQMIKAFEDMGVKPIDAKGKEFDPNFHNAVMMVDDEELESGIVAEEMQKGYMYKDSVVRHSMVKVVN